MIVRLGDIINKVSQNVDRYNTPLQYYIGKGLGECGELALTEKGDLKKDVETLGYQFQFEFHKGDTLFFTKSHHLRKAGYVDFDGVCSIATFVLRSKDSSVLLPEYLPIIIHNDVFWDYCVDNESGSVNTFVRWSTLADYEFTLPSLSEQKVLADKLWAAYRVKESYKKLLAATDDMLKAKFMEMFGEEGEIVIWSDILTIGNGKAYKNEYLTKESGKYPIYGSGGIMGYGNDYLFPENTVIIGRKGNINNPLLVTEEYWAVDTAFSLQIKKNTVDVKWFYYWCKQFDFTKYNKQGVLPSLTRTDLYKITLPLPPLPLQQQFVEIATQAEATKESLRKSIENIDQVIKSLINQ